MHGSKPNSSNIDSGKTNGMKTRIGMCMPSLCLGAEVIRPPSAFGRRPCLLARMLTTTHAQRFGSCAN
eukprot:4991437-Heterocapsa_arctica.AAC.1